MIEQDQILLMEDEEETDDFGAGTDDADDEDADDVELDGDDEDDSDDLDGDEE